jgi:hypothetical protein
MHACAQCGGQGRTHWKYTHPVSFVQGGLALVTIIECRVRQIPLLAGFNRAFTADREEENRLAWRPDLMLRRVAGSTRWRHEPGLPQRVSHR